MRIILTLCIWIGLLVPAVAQNYKVSDLSIGNWSGGAYLNRKTNEFAYCGMFASYKSGIGVHFAIDNDDEWRIGFNSQKFQFRSGNSYSIAYTIDGSPASVLTGVAKDTNFIVVELPSKSALFDQFRSGNMLTVSVAGSIHQFRLEGTSKALAVLLDCARNYSPAGREARRDVRLEHGGALVARQEAEARGDGGDGGAVAVGGGPDEPQVVVDEGRGVGPRRAKVDEADAARLRIPEVVAPVGVRLHEAPVEELGEREAQQRARGGVARRLRHAGRRERVDGHARQPLRDEHARRRERRDDGGHGNVGGQRRLGRHVRAEALLLGRLGGVVALGGQLLRRHLQQ